MQDSTNVIVQAAQGYVDGLRQELDVTLTRMYEILGNDNPYPKVWRILRPLGRLNPAGLRSVQLDFNARCAAILTKPRCTTDARLHKELNEAIQAALSKAPPCEQRTQIIEAMAELEARLAELDRQAETGGSK